MFLLLSRRFMSMLSHSRIQLRIGQAKSALDHSTIYLLSLSVPFIFLYFLQGSYCMVDLSFLST